jgi:DNA polymerase V
MKALHLGVVPASLRCELRYIESWIPAGFPSPASDYEARELDIVEHLIRNRAATFLMRAVGHSMQEAGIFNGDLLIVDRSVTPRSGSIVVVAVDGEYTVKRLKRERGLVWLEAANPDYSPIYFTPEAQVHVFGVVLHAIHTLV